MQKREISVELYQRLLCWAAFEYRFKNNLLGWSEESYLYKCAREGFINSEGQPKKSKVPFNYPDKIDEINRAFNNLKKAKLQYAEVFYLYFVCHVKVKDYAKILEISTRTFYKRLDAALDWFGHYVKI